jgi:hypothetical protein
MTVYCEVVAMVIVVVVVAVGVIELVAGPHVDAVAAAVSPQLRVRGDAKPAIGVRVAVLVTVSPAITFPDVGLRLSVKSTPLPVRVALRPL